MSWSPATRTFMAILEKFPRIRQLGWSSFYNRVASFDPKGQLLFMNYGYAELDGSQPLKLQSEDETFRYQIQLYNQTVKELDLQNKDLVEVSSGRGGGGLFLLKYYHPHSFTGVDISKKAIEWCKQNFKFPNVRWLEGNADALPLPDACADIVINIEASIHYLSTKDFLAEVKRILRPGGYLAISDFRTKKPLTPSKNFLQDFIQFASHPEFGSTAEFQDALEKSGLKIIEKRDITVNVVKALDEMSEKKKKQIDSSTPALLKRAVYDFSAEKSSGLYELFATHQLAYVTYVLQKI